MLWSGRSTSPPDTGGLVRHSHRGTQYLSIRYTERLAEAGIEPSVGSREDTYDNALAESVIGLYKTEIIPKRGPWRGFDPVEMATLEWVDWWNHRRLLEPIGHVPPAEYEMAYYRQQENPAVGAGLDQSGLRNTQGGSGSSEFESWLRHHLESTSTMRRG